MLANGWALAPLLLVCVLVFGLAWWSTTEVHNIEVQYRPDAAPHSNQFGPSDRQENAKQVAPSLQHHPPPERHARGQSSPPVSIVGAAIDDSGESGLCHLTPKLKTYVAAHRTTCHANTTAFAAQTPSRSPFVGLDDGEHFNAGANAFLIHALDEAGRFLCHGGNYYEVRMESTTVRTSAVASVVLTTAHVDLENGLHCINFHVAEPGQYRADVLLAWEGKPEATVVPVHRKLVNRNLGSRSFFVDSTAAASPTSLCTQWRPGHVGRWVRLSKGTCENPFCEGNAKMVSKEGWVYAPYGCHYRLYERNEAWQCVSGKHLLFTGDSTMQEDYLEFIKHLLGIKEGDKVNGPTWKKFRNYDHVHANPHNKQQRVRVQMVWNGHPDHYGLHWGLRTYTDPSHQVRLKDILQPSEATAVDTRRPDFVFINSGMHDVFLYNITLGEYDTIANYTERLVYAIDFLESIRGRDQSVVIWRATKAPAGPKYRNWHINPHKYLQGPLIIDTLQRISRDHVQSRPWMEYMDAWDLTFPFHWDDVYSDGHHYSATKNKMVEYMFLQILLNRVCNGRSGE
uniref:SGNH hydrolase-type esterase domain-containing protein n=1 Tax=Eutreptiella gymnastica TaxID=73025 RepID=A0A7S4GJF1_9EUGL